MEIKQDNLKKLLAFLETILKTSKDEFFRDELLNMISTSLPENEIAGHPLLKRIYEHCIEEVIIKQSGDFYHDFKIEPIKSQLEIDFQRMEHERRRDNFEGFCLAMFQQLENIVNVIFLESDCKEKIRQTRREPFFTKWNTKQQKFIKEGAETVEQQLLLKFKPEQSQDIDKYFDRNSYPIIDYNPNRRSWGFLNRYRAVLYFYYFSQVLKPYEIDDIYETGKILYQVRNENHRGSEPTPAGKKLLAKTKGSECLYYFKFYGFLVNFVSAVNSNLTKAPDSGKEVGEPKVNIKNTPFADIDSLKNLKQSL